MSVLLKALGMRPRRRSSAFTCHASEISDADDSMHSIGSPKKESIPKNCGHSTCHQAPGLMGSVHTYPTASGKRYRVLYRKPDHSQGQKRGFTTKRDAELFLAEVEISKAKGDYVDPADARTTIGMLGADWLKTQTHLKPSSFRPPVETAWRVHVEPEWGSRPVGSIRNSEVAAWVSGLTAAGKGATTVLRAYGVLAAILDVAVRDRRVSRNVARGIPPSLGRSARRASTSRMSRCTGSPKHPETTPRLFARSPTRASDGARSPRSGSGT